MKLKSVPPPAPSSDPAPAPGGSYWYPLFEHMSREHALILLDSELSDIAEVVKKIISSSHDWWVVSTAVQDGVLMLECEKTGALGIVRNPTRKEWKSAFYAPSNPYRWNDPLRVEVIRSGANAS